MLIGLTAMIVLLVIPEGKFSFPVFYSFILAACFFQQKINSVSSENYIPFSILHFVLFSSVHLGLNGLFLLFSKIDYRVLINERRCFLVVFTVSFIVYKMIVRYFSQANHLLLFQMHSQQKKDFLYMYAFLFLNCVYIFVESVASLYFQVEDDQIAYLLCTNLISLILLNYYFYGLKRLLNIEDVENYHMKLNQSISETSQKIGELKTSMNYDGLTGAYTRRYFVQEVHRLQDHCKAFAFAYIDLDNLKEINDTHGHQQGDQYLCDFIMDVRRQVKAKDMVVRYGGDEFIILMPDCSKQEADERMEKVREHTIPFSFGVVDSGEAEEIEELIFLADQRMYERKKRGKVAHA